MKSKLALWLGILIALTLLFAACGTPAMETSPEAPTEAPADDASPTQKPEPTAEPVVPTADTEMEDLTREVTRERTLIIANEVWSDTPDNLNPLVGGALDAGLHQVMMESLFYTNYETGELIPWLAEDYEVSEDGLEATVYLRKGVTWSDGEPFTAADVVFSVNLLREYAPDMRGSSAMREWVDEVTAVDDHTVRFTLTKPGQRFILNYFAVKIHGADGRIVPKHIWEDIEDPLTFTNYDPEQGWPVFTGPYRLVEIRGGGTEMVYDRREDWWGAETGFKVLPAPERIIWVFRGSEEARAASIMADEVDALTQLALGIFESTHNQDPSVIAWTNERPYGWVDPCPHYLSINTQREPWNDPEMRVGLMHAFSPARYSALKQEGVSTPARFLFPSYPPLEDLLDQNQDVLEEYGFDPDKSAAIFESKGYTKGNDGIFVSEDGDRLQLDLVLLNPETWGPSTVAAAAFTQVFGDSGVEVVINALNWGAWGEAFSTGDFGATLHWSCGSVVDPYSTLANWLAENAAPEGEPAQGGNSARWANEEFSASVNEIGTLSPEDPRVDELFGQALEIFMSEAPGIPLEQQYRAVPFNTTYWTNWPTAENNYFMPVDWWQSFLMIVMEIEPAQ
jgi:peptide/nickel transport system substrate-binding protein